jgi:hypothetical protein
MQLTKRAFRALAAPLLLLGLATVARLAAQEESTTLEGYVIDSSCAFTKKLDRPLSRDCAMACAKNGSQLVILTSDGTIYWPISNKMPAQGQNARLTRFAGRRVKISGKLYKRGGSYALVVEEVAVLPSLMNR